MFEGRNPKEESYIFPLNLEGVALTFSIDVKGERNLDHDDRERMSVSINEQGGDCWKIGCCH